MSENYPWIEDKSALTKKNTQATFNEQQQNNFCPAEGEHLQEIVCERNSYWFLKLKRQRWKDLVSVADVKKTFWFMEILSRKVLPLSGKRAVTAECVLWSRRDIRTSKDLRLWFYWASLKWIVGFKYRKWTYFCTKIIHVQGFEFGFPVQSIWIVAAGCSESWSVLLWELKSPLAHVLAFS